MMDITGSQQFAAPPQAVWAALHDTSKPQQCIPRAQQVTWLDARTLRVRAAVDLGPLKGTGEVRAHLDEETAPIHLAVTIIAEGRRLAAHAQLTMDLAADASGTRLTYAGKATLGGLAAALDNPLTRPMLDRGVAHFFASLSQRV